MRVSSTKKIKKQEFSLRSQTMGRIVEKIKRQNAYDIHDAVKKRILESEIRSIETDAIVDTGATYVCLSRKDIEALGLPLHKSVEIKTTNGKASRRTFEGAKIELNGRTSSPITNR
jgi:predicted aspartyl protease